MTHLSSAISMIKAATIARSAALIICASLSFGFADTAAGDSDSLCGSVPPLAGDPWAGIEDLKARESALGPSDLNTLRGMEKRLAFGAYETLLGWAHTHGILFLSDWVEGPVRDALRDLAARGDAEERRGVAVIADGNARDGLDRIFARADKAGPADGTRWRRAARIAYVSDQDRALRMLEALAAADPTDFWDVFALGELYGERNQFENVRRNAETGLKRFPAEAPLFELHLAAVRSYEKSDMDAAKRFKEIVYEAGRAAAAAPEDLSQQRIALLARLLVRDLYVLRENETDMADHYGAILKIAENQARTNPESWKDRRGWSLLLLTLGDSQSRRAGDPAVAFESYRTALAIAEEMATANPADPLFQHDRALVYSKLANAGFVHGRTEEGLEAARKRVAIWDDWVRAHPAEAVPRIELGRACGDLGRLMKLAGNVKAGQELRRRAVALIKPLAARTDNAYWWHLYAVNGGEVPAKNP